jgi:predicted PurR-regulated permease PerM
VFGPGLILWPWAIAAAIGGDFHMAVGLILIYAVITVARQIFEPKILGSQLGIHPLVMLMSMFMGLQLFGLLGFLIGPIIVIVLKTIFETGDERCP